MLEMDRSRRASAVAASRKIHAQARENKDSATEDTQQRGKKRQRPLRQFKKEAATRREDDDEVWEEQEGDLVYAALEQCEEEDDDGKVAVALKRRKKVLETSPLSKADLHCRLFGPRPERINDAHVFAACRPPLRLHTVDYHRPLLLSGPNSRGHRRELLAWYDGVSSARGMPWRKPWLDPRQCGLGEKEPGQQSAAPVANAAPAPSRDALARRAYEVWISEIMAQQTRIATVVGYWTRWMARWPTMGTLAAAAPDDVLAAWKGLGYYSRAARIHAGARAVVADAELRGLLPADAAALQKKVPGIGPYTAGAISAIVFGRPAAMVDGNVLRVLSRQLGIFANSKTNKAVMDLFWAAAEALVRAVAQDPDEGDDSNTCGNAKMDPGLEPEPSDKPGRWGQALMELGSTVCTPKPDCLACPIRATCRAYNEGLLTSHDPDRHHSEQLPDLEDVMCHICAPFDGSLVSASASQNSSSSKAGKKGSKATKVPPKKKSPYFTTEESADADAADNMDAAEAAINHAKVFPLREEKAATRKLETLVCAVRSSDNRILIRRRPAKGLLAGLWELTSRDIDKSLKTKTSSQAGEAAWRKEEAASFVLELLGGSTAASRSAHLSREIGTRKKKGNQKTGTEPERTLQAHMAIPDELGSVPWLFSHITQTMHIYVFEMPLRSENLGKPESCCWARPEEVDEMYSMGTGMVKCWELVKSRIDYLASG